MKFSLPNIKSSAPAPGSSHVGVFKTSILTRRDASRVCKQLLLEDLVSRATVDLTDCDRILRTVSSTSDLNEIITVVQAMGFFIAELPD